MPLEDAPALMERLLEKHYASGTGLKATGVPNIRLFYVEAPIAREPLLCESGLAIVLTGRKIIHLAGDRVEYGAGSYLAVGLPLAVECETIASKSSPLFAIYIQTAPSLLRDVAAAMQLGGDAPEPRRPAVTSAPVSPEMSDATTRLMRILCSDDDAAVLGESAAREVVYRALQGPGRDALQGLLHRDGRAARLAVVMRALHENFADRPSVDEMARMAAMSPSAFHRVFREVTGDTPLQYLKKVRLTQASAFLINDSYRVGAAAAAVGYESAAQFSRDFKKYFGVNAVDARKLGYGFLREPIA